MPTHTHTPQTHTYALFLRLLQIYALTHTNSHIHTPSCSVLSVFSSLKIGSEQENFSLSLHAPSKWCMSVRVYHMCAFERMPIIIWMRVYKCL